MNHSCDVATRNKIIAPAPLNPDTLRGVSENLPEELSPNYEFGGYVIRECIGRGGMARVYRAEQAALHRPVALKVLDRWVMEKPQGSQRFLREARAAAAIKHPNVVDIVDVGVWQERPYIVMELLSGSDLETHLAQYGRLSDTQAASLALPIIAGMMAVHEAGVVHRDLKPSNIFLSNGADGEVVPKVLDFGVSKFSDKLQEPIKGQTKTREIIGTPTYMAPEALNGARELGPRADQYALGAVLYECVVGRPPFEGETLLELLKAIAVGEVPAPRSIRPEISITLEDALLRAMNGNPMARFEALRDFGRALWPLADDRTKTIWQRSFGNGRQTTFGGGETSSLVLVAKNTPRASKPEGRTGRSFPRKLWWVAAFLVAGAVAAPYVLSSFSSERATAAPVSAPSAVASAPATSAEATVERHSLLAEGSTASDDSEPVRDARSLRGSLATRSDGTLGKPAPSSMPSTASPIGRDAPKASARSGSARPQRQVVAATPRRKRPGRADSEAGADDDLDALFRAPEPIEGRQAGADGTRDLDGVFPQDESLTLGANGSPLTD
jgi:eukaryotic-like serine/threonine-protein kinase